MEKSIIVVNIYKNKLERQKMGCISSKKSRHKQPRRKQYSQRMTIQKDQKLAPIEVEQKNKQNDYGRQLQENYQYIMQNQHLTILLDKQLFQDIINRAKLEKWPKQSKNALANLFQDYIRYSVKLISKKSSLIKIPFQYNLTDFGKLFGTEVLQLKQNYTNRNHWNIRSLAYGNEFKKLKFSLDQSNKKQIQSIQKKVKQLDKDDPLAIFYLVSYLKKSCMKMQQQKMSMEQINKKLKEFVDKMNQNFSSNSTPSIEMLYVFMFQQKQFDKLKSEQFSYTKKEFVLKQKDRKIQINNKILQIAQIAKKSEQKLFQLTYQNCIINQGFGYDLNLKVQNHQDQDALRRIKQKLFKDKIQKFYKGMKFQSKSIKKLRKQEFKYKKQVMTKIYENTNQFQFNVTDILRGKCYFKRIAQINKASCDIITKVHQCLSKGQDIQVVQLDNRLRTQTNDIVLKIRLNQIVSQFQLGLRFHQAQSQIYHQMYQISRSQMLSPLIQLYQVERHCTNQYFSTLDQVINQINQPHSIKSQLKKSSKQLRKFIKMEQEEKQSQSDEETGYCHDNPFKGIYNRQNISQEKVIYLSRQTLIRSGDFYAAYGLYQQALKYYRAHLDQKRTSGNNHKAIKKINQIHEILGIKNNKNEIYLQ